MIFVTIQYKENIKFSKSGQLSFDIKDFISTIINKCKNHNIHKRIFGSNVHTFINW